MPNMVLGSYGDKYQTKKTTNHFKGEMVCATRSKN